MRLGLDDGVAEVAIAPRADGGCTVTIAHMKLPAPDHVAHWKTFRADWLAALDDAPA